jgi:predicted membrane protein
MYIHGEILPEKFRFLVNLRVVCRILTATGAFAIILPKPGTEPGVRAEACFLHLTESFIQTHILQTPRRGLLLVRTPEAGPFFAFKEEFFMKTRTNSPARSIVLAALFLALAFVLPMVTGHVPQVGNMLCPMHFPILLCGFVLGGPWGLAVGFVAPLLRSVLFGMPPMFPIAISMAFELAAYGLVSGLVWRRVKHTLPMMYAALVTAMVAGRLVWGAVRFVLAGLTGSSFPFSAFLSGALLTAVPGIIAQLVLIPLILTALQKAKIID